MASKAEIECLEEFRRRTEENNKPIFVIGENGFPVILLPHPKELQPPWVIHVLEVLEVVLDYLSRQLASWQRLLYLLSVLFFFSEFPEGGRPPCTTIPWTIWPALVVLWGVCWMFYPGDSTASGTAEWHEQGEYSWRLPSHSHLTACRDRAALLVAIGPGGRTLSGR